MYHNTTLKLWSRGVSIRNHQMNGMRGTWDGKMDPVATNPDSSNIFRKFRKLTLQTFAYDVLLNLKSIKFSQCLQTDLHICKFETKFVINLQMRTILLQTWQITVHNFAHVYCSTLNSYACKKFANEFA